MSRQDTHLDAMLRHLGAAYYQTLHGEGTAGEVARAVEAITELGTSTNTPRQGRAPEGGQGSGGGARPRHRGRWRVRDVMTMPVASADKTMSYKQLARLMTGHKVNAIPVVTKDGHLAGIVSEADLLRKEERGFRRPAGGLRGSARRELAKARARTAAELMTSPVITIHPDAPLGAAARLMNAHHIRRLPVVDAAGRLIGIVSRRDLLSVFLRPDEEIAAEIGDVLSRILLDEARSLTVTVTDGVVTFSGALSDETLLPAASRLALDVDGVVAVISHLGTAEAAPVTGRAAGAAKAAV